MPAPRLTLTAVVVALAAGRPAPAQPVPPPTLVVLTGTPTPSGGTFTNFLAPVTNAAGTVAFRADRNLGGTGLYAGTAGNFQTVAVVGSPAPAGGNYSNSAPPIRYTLAADGRLAFPFGTTFAGGTRGIFAGPAGGVQAVAFEDTPTPAGGVYTNLSDVTDVALNGSGRVAFEANTAGPTSRAVFAGTPGNVEAVAVRGGTAPAGTVGTFDNFAAVRVNAAGTVAFRANTVQSGNTSGGLFVAPMGGSVQTVAAVGTAVVGGGTITNFAALNAAPPGFNDAGRSAFTATVNFGSGSVASVLTGTPGSVEVVARSGGPAPGGGTYSTFRPPLLNAAGEVAFNSTVNGIPGVTGGRPTLFVGTPGNVQQVARDQTAAPGGGTFFNVGDAAFNAAGQVAFTASLVVGEGGVTTATNEALYAGRPGLLVKVVQKGDAIDVDAGAGVDLRVVTNILITTGSGGQDGLPTGFADDGRIVYTLTFSDGSEGIFSTVVPVPEPAGLLAVAAGGGWVWARVRRRLRA